METQNLNLTTPKLLEYATKALLIYSAQVNIHRERERSHVNITKRGRLSIVFNNGTDFPTKATVRIGDFDKYPVFVINLLSMLQVYTGKEYTEKDLNIY
jgi:hypothetical protein